MSISNNLFKMFIYSIHQLSYSLRTAFLTFHKFIFNRFYYRFIILR